MKVGVLTVPLNSTPLDEALEYLSGLGVEAVEIGCGGYTNGGCHSDPEGMLADKSKIKAYKETFARHNMTVSALSVHGNPVSPDEDFAKLCQDKFETTCKLANEMGIDTVITFSGCPGGAPGDKTPNWVTCAWPDDFGKALKYQWEDVLVPYWQKTAAMAKGYGVNVAFEMHPGFCVYNPETLLKLRAAAGDNLGANFDPSHLWWQGIDVVAAIRKIGEAGAMYHFHAKDVRIDEDNTKINGVLDTKHYGDELHRSWVFRALGYGHDAKVWKDIVSMLRLIGYDKVMSIEHEDSLMTSKEGLEKAIAFLRSVIISEEKPTEMFWA